MRSPHRLRMRVPIDLEQHNNQGSDGLPVEGCKGSLWACGLDLQLLQCTRPGVTDVHHEIGADARRHLHMQQGVLVPSLATVLHHKPQRGPGIIKFRASSKQMASTLYTNWLTC